MKKEIRGKSFSLKSVILICIGIVLFSLAWISIAQNNSNPKMFHLIFEYDKGKISLYKKEIVAGHLPAPPVDLENKKYYFTVINDKRDILFTSSIQIPLERITDRVVLIKDKNGKKEETFEVFTDTLEKTAFNIVAPFDETAKRLIIYEKPEKALISVDLTTIEDNSKYGLSRNGKTIEIGGRRAKNTKVSNKLSDYNSDGEWWVVFLGGDYDNFNDFWIDVQEFYNHLVGVDCGDGIEPFNEYRGHIHFCANPEYYEVECSCKTGQAVCTSWHVSEWQEKASLTYSAYDSIVILANGHAGDSCGGSATLNCEAPNRDGIATCGKKDGDINWLSAIADHEIGHSFGGLLDERSTGGGSQSGPCSYRNCCPKDRGCPKVGCGDCFDENANCELSCRDNNYYVYGDAPGGFCMMAAAVPGREFCSWCKKLIRERLENNI